jgi:hypothetical protein
MNIHLDYDGQTLKWSGKGLAFKATSGMPSHQVPAEQCMPNAGPVPEGEYKVFISDHGVAKDDGRGICALKPSWGIQEISRGVKAESCDQYWANWGKNRARMEPANEATKKKCSPIRAGFYIHDSIKGYSHGCIEVESDLFKHLRHHHSSTKERYLIVQVKYVSGRGTNGGTKI